MKAFRIVFNSLFLCALITTIYTAASYAIWKIGFSNRLGHGSLFNILISIGILLLIVGPFLVAEVEAWYDLHYLIFSKKRTVGQTIFNIFMFLFALGYMAIWVISLFDNFLSDMLNGYVAFLLLPILLMFAVRYFYFAISKAKDNIKPKEEHTITEEAISEDTPV